MALADSSHGTSGRRTGSPAPQLRSKRPPPQLLLALRARRAAHGPRIWLLLLVAALILPLVIPVVGATVAGMYYANTAQELRGRLDKLADYNKHAFQTSRIFDRNGILLYEFINTGRRDPVALDKIAPVLRDATISVEDKTFYENVGVDYSGIVKAAYRNVESGKEVSGASTITQQLIKNIVLSDAERAHDNRYHRKLTEIILAQELADHYTKDQILEMYLNEIPYGNLAYGIQAAAQSYFGVDASALNLSQASLLAGLPQLPTLYNPLQYVASDRVLDGVQLKTGWLNPEAALPYGITPPRARQVEVLRQMVLNGKITERTARDTIAEDLTFASQDVAINAPHFVFYVRQVLEENPILRSLLANQGGLNIITTLDLRVQHMAQFEAAKRIGELEQEGRNIHNAAVVVMQPQTGQILGMVGSVDYNRSQATTTPGETGNVIDGNVNVATRERQPGSALKPFTYLSALEQGKLSAGSVLWDVETKFPTRSDAKRENLNDDQYWYGPKNYTQQWYGPLRMREALANSLNMPAVKALKRAGVSETIDLLHRVGIRGLNESNNYYGLALTLGGGEVTPLDLTTAYNTLANDGTYVPPTPFLKVTDRAGNVLPVISDERRQAIDPKYVAIVRDFMGDNDARTPMFGANNPLHLSRPSHAKTGTSEDFRDAWAVGYTPYVTVGVWTGNNNNEQTARVESTVGGGVIWNRIMESLFNDPELDHLLRGPDLHVPLDFPDPRTYGLELRPICALSGGLSRRSEEWFVATPGVPASTEVDCDLMRTYSIVQEPAGSFCRPVAGQNYGARLIRYQLPNLPISTEDELIVDPRWAYMAPLTSPFPEPTHDCGQDLVSTEPTAAIGGVPLVIDPPMWQEPSLGWQAPAPEWQEPVPDVVIAPPVDPSLAPIEPLPTDIPPPEIAPAPIDVPPAVEIPPSADAQPPLDAPPPAEVPPPVEIPPQPIEAPPPADVPPTEEIPVPVEVPPPVEAPPVEAPPVEAPPVEAPPPVEIPPPESAPVTP